MERRQWLCVALAACTCRSSTPPSPSEQHVAPLVVPKPPEGALRRVSGTRFVLPNEITFLARPATGSFIAAGSDELLGTAMRHPFVVWDDTGREQYRAPPESAVSDAAFDSRGTIVVVAHVKAPIEVIDTKTWTPRSTLEPCGPKDPVAIALSPDDTMLAVACDVGVVMQPIAGGAARPIPGTSGMQRLAWSHDGAWLAVTDANNRVAVVDVHTRTVRHALTATAMHAMAFAPTEPVLAFGDFASTRLFDVAAGVERPPIELSAQALAFRHDGTQLAIATISGSDSVMVVDLATRASHAVVGSARNATTRLAFDATGRLWVAQDHGVRAFDVATGNELIGPQGHRGAVTHLAYSNDGTWLASGSTDRTLRVWNLAAGTSSVLEVAGPDDNILPLPGDDAAARKVTLAAATGLAWTADGNLIATDTYMLREWDPKTLALVIAKRLQSELGGVAVLADGTVVTLGLDDLHVSLAWSDRQGKELRRVELATTDIYPRLRLAASGDRRRLAVSGRTIEVVDAATGVVVGDGNDSDARGLALDRTGSLLGIAGDSVLHFEPIGRHDDVELAGTSVRPTAIALTADGNRAIVGGIDGEVVVLDRRASAVPVEHAGHHGAVRAIAIDPRGTSFATAGDDGAIVIWPLN
jgi:WD40 repeat protein